MIRSHSEYRESLRRLEVGKCQAAEYEAKLKDMGLEPAELERGMASLIFFQKKLEEEIRRYQRLRSGEIEEYWDLRDFGLLLIEARMVRGLSQRDLAKKLGIHESQVSRDERNTYHGVSHERACQILDAIGVKTCFRVELQPRASQSEVTVLSPLIDHLDFVEKMSTRRKYEAEPEMNLGLSNSQLPSTAA